VSHYPITHYLDTFSPLLLSGCRVWTAVLLAHFTLRAASLIAIFLSVRNIRNNYSFSKMTFVGKDYSPEDDEDMASAMVTSIFILQGRRKIKPGNAMAGNWVFLDDVDTTIAKTATVTSFTEDSTGDGNEAIRFFRPLSFAHAGHESVMKLAVEPLNPAELPKNGWRSAPTIQVLSHIKNQSRRTRRTRLTWDWWTVLGLYVAWFVSRLIIYWSQSGWSSCGI